MADSNKKYTSVLSDGTDEFTIKDSEAVKAVKVGSSGSAITPTNGTVTIPTYEEGAQANVIETVKVNGTALTPDANKAVNVEFEIPERVTSTDLAGFVV